MTCLLLHIAYVSWLNHKSRELLFLVYITYRTSTWKNYGIILNVIYINVWIRTIFYFISFFKLNAKTWTFICQRKLLLPFYTSSVELVQHKWALSTYIQLVTVSLKRDIIKRSPTNSKNKIILDRQKIVNDQQKRDKTTKVTTNIFRKKRRQMGVNDGDCCTCWWLYLAAKYNDLVVKVNLITRMNFTVNVDIM